MKRTITRLISLLLFLTICISTLPIQAFAWGKMTHTYTANLIEGEILNGNNSIAVGNSTFEYDIPDEYYEAIMAYPEAFRAGALGPDTYPDILTGQLFIHPEDKNIDSGEWITYLCNAVNKMGKGTEGRKMCLSFTLGCILHYCGDLYGHDFVNTFAGGSFPSILSTEIFDIKGDRLNNILSHLTIESYMDDLVYPNYDKDTFGDIDAPDSFITNSMIFDGTPAAGLNPLYEKYPAIATDILDKIQAELEGVWLVEDAVDTIIEDFFDENGNNVPPHYIAMLALRTYVTSTADEYREHMEPVSAGVTAFYDEWAEDIDKGIVEFTAACDRIASRIVTGEKNPEIEAKTEKERKEEQNKILAYMGYGDIASLNMQSLISKYYPNRDVARIQKELNSAGLYGDSFFDIILAELVLQGSITTDMLKSENSSIMIIKEELSHWLNEYGVYMLCVPDVIIDGIEIPIIGDVVDIISAFIDLLILEPLWDWIIGEIKNLISGWVISFCTGSVATFTGWTEEEVPEKLKELVSKITARLYDPEVQLDHTDNPYRPSENNFADLKEYMDVLAKEVKYQTVDSDFEALYNTIAMFKLVLMGPENYTKFTKTYAGVNQTAYQMNTASPEATSLKLRIKTSDLYLAGTNDNIYAIIYRVDANGSKTKITQKLLDHSATDDFESGETATYIVELPESIKLSQMEIALKKTPSFDFLPGITDDWCCENIRVTPMYAGYELTAPVDLGGISLKGRCESIGMNFQAALKAKAPENPKTQNVTNLLVQIKVKDEMYAGTDSDIYLKIYNNGSLYQTVLLDKAIYNDLERGDNDVYNIPIVRPGTNSQAIPLNLLSIKFDHTGSDETNWENVTITPCYGSIKLTEAFSVGGKTFEKTVWKPELQKSLKKATYRQNPNLSKTATSLEVQIDVANEFGAGTDDDIYLNIYSGNNSKATQRILLDKDNYNDFEMGDSDIYTITLSKEAAKIPLNQLRLEFEKSGYSDKHSSDLIDYTDDAKWDDVLVTPYNGSKALTDPISLCGTDFDDRFWDTKFQNQLQLHYNPVVLSYKSNLDDGLLCYMDSLDGGEEWVDDKNELWANTTLRKEIFFKIFKGFAPEIEYAGPESLHKGDPIKLTLNVTDMWNGVSNERRSQVKDFEHVYELKGNVAIEVISSSGEVVSKVSGLKVVDDKVSITLPANDKFVAGSYDVKVIYQENASDPMYANTEVVFEDAFQVVARNSYVVNAGVSSAGGGNTSGSGTFEDGKSCTVVAYPQPGYQFIEWRNGTTVVSKNASYTFKVTESCKLTAVFEPIKSAFTSVINDGKSTVELTRGEVYSLYAKIDGGTAPYTYEWQYLDPGKTTWTRGTTDKSAGMVGDDSINGRKWRVEVTDVRGRKSISNEVTVLIKNNAVAGEKLAVKINNGEKEIVFESSGKYETKTLVANVTGGEGYCTYKWYRKDSNGDWQLVSTYSTCEVTSMEEFNNDKFKVEVTDSAGTKVTSDEITVKIKYIVVN